jgi:hypothetical protein
MIELEWWSLALIVAATSVCTMAMTLLLLNPTIESLFRMIRELNERE